MTANFVLASGGAMQVHLGTLLFVIVGGTAILGQAGGPPAPPRDRLATPSVDADARRLAGRVLAADTGRPLRRAVVQLTSGNIPDARWTTSDEQGAWSFADVAFGEYTVRASRDGYVAMEYGQKRPYGVSVTIDVTPTANLEHLDIVLPRGGVIAGRVSDEMGEPVGSAIVRAHRVAFVDGLRQLIPVIEGIQLFAFGGVTDDRGEYRLFGLAPGTYYVSANHGPFVSGQSDDRQAYATTYFPGSPSVAAASPVEVRAGGEAAASFGLSRVSLVGVQGRLTNSLGQGTQGNVRLVAIAPGYAFEAGSRYVVADADGRFSFSGVAAGEYFLQVTVRARDRVSEAAVATVTVSDEAIRNLFVMTAPTATGTGQLVLDGPLAGQTLSGFSVAVVPTEPTAINADGGVMPRTNAAGRFVLPGLAGPHLLRLRNPPSGWWLKSVRIDGRETVDAPYDFLPGQNVEVEVAVTRQMATVSGTTSDAAGRLTSGCSVVVFSLNEEHWGPGTRFVTASVPADDGRFSVGGLPPGEYGIVAVPPLEAGEESDVDRLRAWRSLARRVSLADRPVAGVSLTVAEP